MVKLVILYFHFTDYVYEYPLPSFNDRRVTLNLNEQLEEGCGDVCFEVWDNIWHIVSVAGTALTVDGESFDDRILTPGDVINGKVGAGGKDFAIRVLSIDLSYTTYEKYALFEKTSFEIGSGTESDIVINDTYASRQHATLRREGAETYLSDHSTNGTYVMSRRVKGDCKLDIMDDIYIAGIKFVYMGDFLAINQPEKHYARLQKYYLPPYNGTANAEQDSTALIRSPRVLEPIDREAVELESPPAPQQSRRQPVIFTIGPAVTMPLPILASVFFMAGQGSNYIMGTVVSVALSALVAAGWAIASVTYEKHRTKKDEEHRQKSYLAYIAENDAHIKQKQRKNTELMNGQHLSLSEINSVLQYNRAVLWNRNIYQPDFLSVRLGMGCVRSWFDIVVPKRKFSLVADDLQKQPHGLLKKYAYVSENVSLLNLKGANVIGVLGDRGAVRSVAAAVAMQTAALHCYTDVKMVFILRPGEERYFEWARPLPHTRWQENKIRLICTNDAERQNVLFYLNGILRSRMEARGGAKGDKKHPLPHIVVFCTSPELIIRENLSRYMSDNAAFGLTFVLLYEHMDRLPNECSHVIQCDSEFHGYYRLDESRDVTNAVKFDEVNTRLLSNLSRRLSGYTVTELSTGEIPNSISFLDMYGMSNLSEWELIKRWKENRAYESLRAMIGIGVGGKPLFLDIHEKQHGPHGLIAGTTGSGKSETIQTYILSLVMNFHPTEISLILIDYKGGGMANAFVGLPHHAGTITNLDGSQTIRALRSIKAEIKRRLTLFNKYNVNHIDSYARFFRSGTATEPMPHLIIISDEFAELKKEQPEFIKELVSAARVGRSLGVHLILATQKPSGVVDDDIWSNSRFKICLRVQDKQDSNEMLHRTDAASLTQTGRAYMQIGNDEIFELFQSGYSGAYYEPEDAGARENAVTMIGLDGSPLMFRQKKNAGAQENRPTQLKAAVGFINDTAESLGIAHARQLWLPELYEGIDLAKVREFYPVTEENGVAALFGLIDDPNSQTQYGASVNFSATGNTLIAGLPGVGKSTMLQTVLFSLAMDYKPEEVNFYVIDCSGSLTKVFAGIPHCGGIVDPDDEERVTRLFSLMQSIINERSKLFNKVQVGSYDEFRMASGQALPVIVFAIDNLFAFNDRYPDTVDENLTSMSAGCVKYGIHLLFTVNHMSDIKFKLRQNFTTVYPLQLAERGDYHDALGVMPEFLPTQLKGRGLWGKESLEYQTAFAVAGENEQVRAENIRAAFTGAGYDGYTGFCAEPIRFIDKDQPYDAFIAENGSDDALCIGYNKQDITIHSIPLSALYCYAVSAAVRKPLDNMMRNLTDAAGSLGAKRHICALRYEPEPGTVYDGVYRDGESVMELLVLLREEFTRRSALKKELSENNPDNSFDCFSAVREQFGLLFVFIDNMNDFLNVIYEPREEEYNPLVELYFKQGKGLGVYFIAGFDQQVYAANMFRDAYKLFTEYGTGIHLGGQLDKQKLYDIPFLSRELIAPQDITDGFTSEDDRFVNVFVPVNIL